MIEERSSTGERTVQLTILEKAVVGLFSSLTLVVLVWVGSNVSALNARMAVVETQVTLAAEDRYTGAQGRAHEAEFERRVSNIEQRLERLR
jgi:hypothetical protein